GFTTIFGLVEPAKLRNSLSSQLGNLVLHIGERPVAPRRRQRNFLNARDNLIECHANAHAITGCTDHWVVEPITSARFVSDPAEPILEAATLTSGRFPFVKCGVVLRGPGAFVLRLRDFPHPVRQCRDRYPGVEPFVAPAVYRAGWQQHVSSEAA